MKQRASQELHSSALSQIRLKVTHRLTRSEDRSDGGSQGRCLRGKDYTMSRAGRQPSAKIPNHALLPETRRVSVSGWGYEIVYKPHEMC